MQNFNDDNDWDDPLPSLQETLELLPELRETAEALGNLRTDPNHNDPKSSGHPGPPTSRAIAPLRTPPRNRTISSEPAVYPRRPKPDVSGLYTPRPHRRAYLSSEDNDTSIPTAPYPNLPPKKGSYRAAMAEARLAIAEKKSRIQFTRANESDSDREFRGRIANSTALDRHKKLYAFSRDKEKNPEASNSAQRVEKTSNVYPSQFVKSSQPAPDPKPISRKRRYVARESYISASDSSESGSDTEEPSRDAKLSKLWRGSPPPRRTITSRSASPPTSQKSTSDQDRSVPPGTTEEPTGKVRPRRRAAVAAMERARSQIDDPFPGLFAPRRVNRRSAEQKALMPMPTRREPVVKMRESASEEDEMPRSSISVRRQNSQLFYKMESIDPED
ncbi:hypothetical protein HOY82DRAFT_612823 [Tuber indicum]|nr:hypothetical protein HOY82DRAFT_612823 [Tuber indicum]